MLWVKAFHIIAMVCWFAGLFYLPRLFVYHAACDDQPGRERFKVMERKLYRGITTPSMIAVGTSEKSRCRSAPASSITTCSLL